MSNISLSLFQTKPTGTQKHILADNIILHLDLVIDGGLSVVEGYKPENPQATFCCKLVL